MECCNDFPCKPASISGRGGPAVIPALSKACVTRHHGPPSLDGGFSLSNLVATLASLSAISFAAIPGDLQSSIA